MATFTIHIRNVKMYQILYMVKNKYYLILSYLRFYEGFTTEENLQPTVLSIEIFVKKVLLLQYWLMQFC